MFWIAYALLAPLLLTVFRVRRSGAEHVPSRGGAVLTANHRSFIDPFFLALLRRRRVYFVAKAELMSNPVIGWVLVRMGAIPIRRGATDEEALRTAETLLERGELVGIFPEGTRGSGGPGRPKRGAARLAISSRSPIVPCGMTGTEDAHELRIGHRIGLAALAPILPEPDADRLTERLWREVETARVDAENLVG